MWCCVYYKHLHTYAYTYEQSLCRVDARYTLHTSIAIVTTIVSVCLFCDVISPHTHDFQSNEGKNSGTYINKVRSLTRTHTEGKKNKQTNLTEFHSPYVFVYWLRKALKNVCCVYRVIIVHSLVYISPISFWSFLFKFHPRCGMIILNDCVRL